SRLQPRTSLWEAGRDPTAAPPRGAAASTARFAPGGGRCLPRHGGGLVRTPAVFGVGEAARRARRARALPPQRSGAVAVLAAVAASMALAGSCRTLPRAPTAAPGRQPAPPRGLTPAPAPVQAYVPGPIVRRRLPVDPPPPA